MKKFILFLALTLSSVSFAQIKKVELAKSDLIGKIQVFGAPVMAECTKKGDVYTISYKDEEYKTLTEFKEFSFKDIDNAFEDLYSTLLDGLEKLPEEPVTLDLPEHLVSLDFKKSFGVATIRFITTQKGTGITGHSSQYTKKQIEKLFGKRK